MGCTDGIDNRKIIKNNIDITPFYNNISIEDILKLELKYQATYMLETEFWYEMGNRSYLTRLIGLLFFQSNPKPNHSPYFIIINLSHSSSISNGLSTVKNLILTTVKDKKGLHHYSRSNTNYNEFEKGCAIDGGRSYTNVLGRGMKENIKNFVIIKDKFYEITT